MEKIDVILKQYDFVPIATKKGRGNILVETKDGTYVVSTYNGLSKKIEVQDHLLQKIQENQLDTDRLIRNKEGMLLSFDKEKRAYFCKVRKEGRECDYTNLEECKQAVRAMVKMHALLYDPSCGMPSEEKMHFANEVKKRNNDLKRARKFLLARTHKKEFEFLLLQLYNEFAPQAYEAYDLCKEEKMKAFEEKEAVKGSVCHGDFQYHNILINNKGMAIVGLESYCMDVHCRDFCHFFRKIMEKNEWDESMGDALYSYYLQLQDPCEEELKLFYSKLLYPEKFWKIVHFYLNHNKSFISSKNTEKCMQLLELEQKRQYFLKRIYVDIFTKKV